MNDQNMNQWMNGPIKMKSEGVPQEVPARNQHAPYRLALLHRKLVHWIQRMPVAGVPGHEEAEGRWVGIQDLALELTEWILVQSRLIKLAGRRLR